MVHVYIRVKSVTISWRFTRCGIISEGIMCLSTCNNLDMCINFTRIKTHNPSKIIHIE